MPQFFMNKRLIILLVGIIILVALIGFSLRERDSYHGQSSLLKIRQALFSRYLQSPHNPLRALLIIFKI